MPEPQHHEQMMRMMTGYWVSQAIYVAAKLGIADLIDDGMESVDQLAEATATHPRSLYRLLRALASVSIFAEREGRRFALTPLAECLRDDAPGSQRSTAIMFGEEHYNCYGDLPGIALHTVQEVDRLANGNTVICRLDRRREASRLARRGAGDRGHARQEGRLGPAGPGDPRPGLVDPTARRAGRPGGRRSPEVSR